MELIRIGARYLNLERVTEIRDTGLELELFFEANQATVLRGADAERLREWLTLTATDLNPTDRDDDAP